ncbi:MAG TPA: hypothetical protein VKM55_24550 [Candidatus Lokiarchaeia archaeon]|nr:hypothetical protein [Candidatus Lokiarchaeia archaeon]
MTWAVLGGSREESGYRARDCERGNGRGLTWESRHGSAFRPFTMVFHCSKEQWVGPQDREGVIFEGHDLKAEARGIDRGLECLIPSC